jgi:transcription termination/antitermination protein NusG
MEPAFASSAVLSGRPGRSAQSALTAKRPAQTHRPSPRASLTAEDPTPVRGTGLGAAQDGELIILGGEMPAGSLDDALTRDWDSIDSFGELGLVADALEVEEEEQLAPLPDSATTTKNITPAANATSDRAKAETRASAARALPGDDDPKSAKAGDATFYESAGTEKFGGAVSTPFNPTEVLAASFENEEDAAAAARAARTAPDAATARIMKAAIAEREEVAREAIAENNPADVFDAPEDSEKNMSQAEINAAEVWDVEPRWYFLQVKPGCERSCSISIANMATALSHVNIKEVLVPTIQTMRLTKGGKTVKKEERMFPGYMLVCMVMDRQSYSDIRNVTNIQWFMGDPNRDKKKDDPFRPPIPASDEEMRAVFDRIRVADSAVVEVKTNFRPGDLIRVTSGPFNDSEGIVQEVKPDMNVLIAGLPVFGRETPVELELDQVTLVTSASVLNPKKKRGRKSKADIEAEAELAHQALEEYEMFATEVTEPATASQAAEDGDFDEVWGEQDDSGFESSTIE